MSIICPNCGTVSTDEDFDEGKEEVGMFTNSDGNWVCECWECGQHWVQTPDGNILEQWREDNGRTR